MKGRIECRLTLIKSLSKYNKTRNEIRGKARVFVVFKAINEHDMLDERFSRCIKMPGHAVRHIFTTTLEKKG